MGRIPSWHSGTESISNAGDPRDPGLIPGFRRSPEEGNGNRLQYTCLESSIDRGVRGATVHGVAKDQTQLSTKEQDYTSRSSMVCQLITLSRYQFAIFNQIKSKIVVMTLTCRRYGFHSITHLYHCLGIKPLFFFFGGWFKQGEICQFIKRTPKINSTNCVPPQVEVLSLSSSECDLIWQQHQYRYKQLSQNEIILDQGGPPIQCDQCLY